MKDDREEINLNDAVDELMDQKLADLRAELEQAQLELMEQKIIHLRALERAANRRADDLARVVSSMMHISCTAMERIREAIDGKYDSEEG